MKVMIVGAYPSGNKGGEAMLEVVTQNLIYRMPSLSFLFEMISSKEDYSAFEQKNYKFELTKFTAKNIISPYSSSLKSIDIVIDIGGLVYTDKSIRDNLRSFVKHFSLIARRKKIIFFTQDCGPANKLHTRVLGGFVMRRAARIFARSSFSVDVLEKDFKVRKKNIIGPVPDSTLILKDDDAPNLVDAENYVVISPSAIMFNKYGQDYLKLVSSIISLVSKKHKVYLLVHSFTKNGEVSDQDVVLKLRDMNRDVIVINENVSTLILKNVLSNAKYVISSRYHVIVGAMSSNVPAIAIGWNPKYESFLKLYKMQENSIAISDESLYFLSKTIENIENNYSQITHSLRIINSSLSKKVEESFNFLVAELHRVSDGDKG